MRARMKSVVLGLAIIIALAVGTASVYALDCCINCYECIICETGCETCVTDRQNCAIYGVGCTGNIVDCMA